jgi:2-hydroxychromene-2-carboxylate isomerase
MVEFFYDVGSPYSYLAASRIEDLAARHQAVLAWRPFLLGGVFKTLGLTAPALQSPAKARWLLADLERWAARYGVPFRMNPHFPVNTLTAMRMIVAAEERGHQMPLMRRLFPAMWAEGEDLADPEVLVRLADEASVPGRSLLERTAAGHVKDRLRASTEEAVRRGAFGAPTIFLGDEMFFGNDRLDQVEVALAA